jgi:DNA-binding SARP family transcriptional activator
MIAPRYRVHVLGGWTLAGPDGEPVSARGPIARVVAYLALRGGVQQRGVVAGSLWPEVCDQRASSNLRSTLWHARTEIDGLLDGHVTHVWLGDAVSVDLDAATASARRVLAGQRLSGAEVEHLLEDVLPDWDEEWLAIPRFLHRQLRLQALDRAIATELDLYGPATALPLARRVAAQEPRRESTIRLLMECRPASPGLGPPGRALAGTG